MINELRDGAHRRAVYVLSKTVLIYRRETTKRGHVVVIFRVIYYFAMCVRVHVCTCRGTEQYKHKNMTCRGLEMKCGQSQLTEIRSSCSRMSTELSKAHKQLNTIVVERIGVKKKDIYKYKVPIDNASVYYTHQLKLFVQSK